jgi:hypothetical protein
MPGFSLSASNPASGDILHRTQAVELLFAVQLNLATVTTGNVQVHDDTLGIDLGVDGRATVQGQNASGSQSAITVAPVAGKWWGYGHSLRITVTENVKNSGGGAVGPLVFTFPVEAEPLPRTLLHPDARQLQVQRYLGAEQPWKQQRSDLLAWAAQPFLTSLLSVPWVGKPADEAEITAMYTGSYNRSTAGVQRGAYVDSELARLDAIRGRAEGLTAKSDAAKTLILAWANALIPGSITSSDTTLWKTAGLTYALLGHRFLDAYEWCADRFTTAEKTTFQTWVKRFVAAVVDAQRRTSGQDLPLVRSWCNALALRAAYLLGDYRLENWVLVGTTAYRTVENAEWTNPYPLYGVLETYVENSDHRGGPYPRLWDRRQAADDPAREATLPILHLQALQTLAHLYWMATGDAKVWTYKHTLYGTTLKDLNAEYRKFVLRQAGYRLPLSDAQRCAAAWKLTSWANLALPSAVLRNLILPGSRGGHPADVETDLAAAAPAFALGYPGSALVSCPTPEAPRLPPADTWRRGRTWLLVSWDPPPVRSEADLPAWGVLLNGAEVGRTVEPRYCLPNLTPGTRYRVSVKARTECGTSTDSQTVIVSTLPW